MEDESKKHAILQRLKDPNNSPQIKDELLEFALFLEIFLEASKNKELSPVVSFFEELNKEKNIDLLKYIDWDAIIYPVDVSKLDYNLCYELFLKYMNASFKKYSSGKQLFLILLFEINAKKLHIDLTKEFDDEDIIYDIGYYHSFNSSYEEFEIFRNNLMGEISNKR